MTTRNRHDPYGPVHKGIRAAHMKCLVAIGRADTADNADMERLAARISDHLTMCRAHLEDENTVLHTALESRRPGASAHAAEDHDDHLAGFEELRGLVDELEASGPTERATVLAALYRRFARFVADDLEHMDHEEQVLLRDLQETLTDAELQELEGQIVASIAPAHMVLFLDAMLDGLPTTDSGAMLAGMKAGMPPSAYADLMAAVEARRTARPMQSAA